MPFGVLKQRRKHNRQDRLDVVADKVAEILIIPEVQCALSHLVDIQWPERDEDGLNTYLEMRTGNRLGQLIEQWLLNLGKLGGIHDFEDVLYLV